MLALTDQAMSAIRQFETTPGTPQGAGLRISSDPSDGSLNLDMAPAPQQGDEIISRSGVLVFLDNQAASLLEDKMMDASTNRDGLVQFSFSKQPA